MPEGLQDLFISHAGSDKERYIQPLVDRLTDRQTTFWLDNLEVSWGDSIPLRVNEGLRHCRYVLLCLSSNFVRRPWPEAELGSALAFQNATGQKRVLPLILNSKELVFSTYPLLVSLSYKEFDDSHLVDDIANIVRPVGKTASDINVIVESVYTGKLCNIDVSLRVSIKWLADKAKRGIGVSDLADSGAYRPFRVRWVLVDTKVEHGWLALSRWEKRQMLAVVASADGARFFKSETDKLGDIGVADGTVFHLYAIEDERYAVEIVCAE